MTLNEAIKHYEEIAEKEERSAKLHPRPDKDVKGSGKKYLNCVKCAKEHRQLAEWLKELKRLREQTEPEKCGDCISRQAVDELSKALVHTTRDKADFLCNFWEELRKLPPIEPERKPGKWINVDGSTNSADCSCCGNRGRAWMNYCYLCGAKMEVD